METIKEEGQKVETLKMGYLLLVHPVYMVSQIRAIALVAKIKN